MTFNQLITLVGGTPFVVALAAAIFTWLQQQLVAHLPASKLAALKQHVISIVTAVEQIGDTQKLTGEEKKERAVAFVNTIAKDLHLPAPPALVDVLIEEAVSLLPDSEPAPVPAQTQVPAA